MESVLQGPRSVHGGWFSVCSLTYVDLFRPPGFPKCQGEAEKEVFVGPELAVPFCFRNALHQPVGWVDCPSRAFARLTWRGAIALAELETTVLNSVGVGRAWDLHASPDAAGLGAMLPEPLSVPAGLRVGWGNFRSPGSHRLPCVLWEGRV